MSILNVQGTIISLIVTVNKVQNKIIEQLFETPCRVTRNFQMEFSRELFFREQNFSTRSRFNFTQLSRSRRSHWSTLHTDRPQQTYPIGTKSPG